MSTHDTRMRVGLLLLAWIAVIGFHFFPLDLVGSPLPPAMAFSVFAAIVTVILMSSFGVVGEASALATRLGEPYGSLILTLSVVLIEVALIVAVMVGPTPAPTIARESIYSVMMIIVNLVIGLAIVVGARRHGPQSFNHQGTSIYLVLIVGMGSLAFLGPRLFRPFTGAFPLSMGVVIGMGVGVIYAAFLFLQMGRWKTFFQEERGRRSHEEGASPASTSQNFLIEGESAYAHEDIVLTHSLASQTRVEGEEKSRAKGERLDSLPARFTILIFLLLAIALLAEHLAVLIDFGVSEAGLPLALGGIMIATIVFTPESLTTLKAARSNEMQRVINLCLGAFVSTVGLTFPAVLLIGAATGIPVIFALRDLDAALFLATCGLTALTFTRHKTTLPYGIAHLVLFAVFIATVFVS